MSRAPCGCLIEDGMVLHGFDGPCFLERPRSYGEPTEEDYCEMGGHIYAGDDGERGRCYCGQQSYPVGGPKGDTP